MGEAPTFFNFSNEHSSCFRQYLNVVNKDWVVNVAEFGDPGIGQIWMPWGGHTLGQDFAHSHLEILPHCTPIFFRWFMRDAPGLEGWHKK